MKALLIYTSFLLALSVHAQTDQIKKAEDILAGNASDSTKFQACIDLHNAYYVSEPAKSKTYADLMLTLAKQMQDDRYLSKAYLALARCYEKNRNHKQVIFYHQAVLSLAKKSGKTPAILSAQLTLARNYLDADDPSKALPYLRTSDRLCVQVNDSNQIAKVKQTYGWYYVKINQHRKAALCFDSARALFAMTSNAKMVASCEIHAVTSLLALGETDRIPALLFSALEYYKKNNVRSSQAYCYGLLGQCYFMNGFEQKGVENYLESIRLYNIANSKVEEAFAIVDLARHFLSKKDYEQAEKYAREADKLLNEHKYDYGIIMMKTFWGQYYSEKGSYFAAEEYFSEADRMALTNSLPELKTENQKYWAEHRFRQKNYRGADSLMYSYAEKIVGTKEPEVISNELATVLKKNRNLDSNTIKVLSLLYSPGGVETLKKRLGNKSLTGSGSLDSIFKLNPFSHASASYDSSMSVTYNAQLLQMETQFRTRQIADSLRIELQNSAIARETVRNRNIILVGTGVVLLLLATGLWLQYRSRMRAEQDKAKIELLQNEIHHRVKNNLGVISRLVEVAGKNAVDAVPLSSLKNRIKSIELLHNHLYSEEVRTGNISLQSYFEDLCMAVAATYETAKNIQIDIKATAEIDSRIAEKLGLIINELVTNCYKYAFEGMEAGKIHISAREGSGKSMQITVADDGVGFEAEKIKTSYGMKLIKGLCHQLHGRFAFVNDGGTRFTLEIPV